MTPEKELILAKFNTLMYIDNNIASIIDNYMNGEVEIYYPGEDILKTKYSIRCSVKEGEYKEWHVNGVLRVHTTYKGGKIHGEFRRWWSNRRPMLECYYKEGILDGEFKSWYRYGKPESECFYKEGKLHGEYKTWEPDGEIHHHRYYENGLKIKVIL